MGLTSAATSRGHKHRFISFTVCLLGMLACATLSQSAPDRIRMAAVPGADDELLQVYFRVLDQDGEAIRCDGHITFQIHDSVDGQEESLLYEAEFDVGAGDYERVSFPGWAFRSDRPQPWGYRWEIPLTAIQSSAVIVYDQNQMAEARAVIEITTPQGGQFEAAETTKVLGSLAAWKVEIGDATIRTDAGNEEYPWVLSIPATITNTGEADLINLETWWKLGGSHLLSMLEAPLGNIDYLPAGSSEQVKVLVGVQKGEDLQPGQEIVVTAELVISHFAKGSEFGLEQSEAREFLLTLP